MEILDYLASLKAKINTNTTDISNRLRKDQADAPPFTLGVGSSQTMNDAVTKKELVGGLLRPYRLFKNVGSVATGATVRAGQDPQVTDVFGAGMVYKITNIRVTTITQPTLTSTITIKANGTTIYTMNVAVGLLPGIGKIVELLTLTGSTYPADVTLPATFTCTASAGTFDIFIDGVLV